MLEENELSAEVLPYMHKFKGKTFVIKYGGSIMNELESKKAFIEDVVLMKLMGINIVIVHGGGPEISRWLNKIGIESKFVKGLRVTDKKVIDIIEMVLSGKINKDIAANLSSHGITAVGLSGRDGNLIKATKKRVIDGGKVVDIGYVGEIQSVNTELLQNLLEKGEVPVISPIGCDSNCNKYNINADYAASFISAELNAEKLIILTDVEGVYKDIDDKSSLISNISIEEIQNYIHEGIISGGMIPKMECCIEAIEKGTKNIHLIDGRKKHSLIMDIISNSGTSISRNGGVKVCQEAI